MSSSQLVDDEERLIDPVQPLRDIIACCTSIPPDQRTDIAAKVEELGGVHKYDLTPDVTHLIVGDYDTPKYRHVARERPDIKAMDAAWIGALADLWRNDQDINFAALEKQHQLKPLECRGSEMPSAHQARSTGRQSLLVCLTGFGEQRDDIASRIVANGGRYTGDLTRRCTHLIVSKPEGKKFTAAKSWNVYTVTLDWLDQSIERGMILEEAKFDPLLPVDEQGVGAWIKKDTFLPRKRSRCSASNSTDERGPRKLRKTASMKLNSQRSNLWGDILGRSSSREHSFVNEPTSRNPSLDQQAALLEPTIQPPHSHHLDKPLGNAHDAGVFSNCIFAIDGFNDKRHAVLNDTITTLGGHVASSLSEVAVTTVQAENPHRFLIVPQNSAASTHPKLPSDKVEIVTEFYIEKCLHSKQLLHPSEHVLGRPFPVFPIPGFTNLIVCSAAFTGLELSQMARSTSQLGAKFEEEFRRTTNVLVCKSLAAMRKDKLKYALEWGVPIVPADWLWECISTGFNVPVENFIFPELKARYETRTCPAESKVKNQPSQSSTTKPGSCRRKTVGGFDASGFDEDFESPGESCPAGRDAILRSKQRLSRREWTTSAAPFFPAKIQVGDEERPLTELSGARINKSPSLPKHGFPPTRTKSDPTPDEATTTTNAPMKCRGPSAPPDMLHERTADAATCEHEDANRRESEREQRQQRKASERQALSSKLSDLIQAATTASLSNDTNSHAQATARPRGRRQLLGRAVSNVSNGSSSATSLNGDGSGSVSVPRQMTDSLRAAVAAGADDDLADHQESLPPSTQLQYADPEAMQRKEEIMSRLMGGNNTDAKFIKVKSEPVGGGRSLRKR